MRKWLYTATLNCPAQAAFSAGRVFTTGGTEGPEGEGDSPNRPFIVIRLNTHQQPLTRLPGTKVRQQFVQVWLHDEPGSMVKIDTMLKALEAWLPSQVGVDAQGNYVMECSFEDSSGDGYDDHFKTSTRYATFKITYNEA